MVSVVNVHNKWYLPALGGGGARRRLFKWCVAFGVDSSVGLPADLVGFLSLAMRRLSRVPRCPGVRTRTSAKVLTFFSGSGLSYRRLLAGFKHIIKRRNRNQMGFP